MATGRIYLLPLDQLAYAQMDTDGKEQLLHLSFATHEIMVRGNTLRRIETALHRLELSSFITPLPAKYHSLVAEGQPGIREIVVMEINSASDQSQLN
jgi:D-lyxose ketol-isomerase